MSVTLSSLPGKFKCSLLNVFFCPGGITPNYGLTGPNNIYINLGLCKHIVNGTEIIELGHWVPLTMPS